MSKARRLSEPLVRDPAQNPSISIIAGHSMEGMVYRIQRERGTPNWLLVYTPSGVGRVTVGNDQKLCGTDSLAIWAPGTVHDYGTSDADTYWEQLWVHVSPTVTYESMLSRMCRRGSISIIENAGSDVADKFRRIASQPRTTIGELRAMNLLESMLLNLIEGRGIEEETTPVTQARKYILANLQNSVSVEDIAKHVGLSSSRLTALFRHEYGESPRVVLEKERLILAKQLLRLTSLPIQTIAQQIGFENPFYFTLRFKKDAGMSPTEFRKKA